ncbi:MAG: hypothetical protein AAFX93_19000 [Verrucomicrobiota bacterium]
MTTDAKQKLQTWIVIGGAVAIVFAAYIVGSDYRQVRDETRENSDTNLSQSHAISEFRQSITRQTEATEELKEAIMELRITLARDGE